MEAQTVKIDMHLHSKYSRNPSTWILKKIGCPESFSEPLRLYQMARQQGLTHVTITDHNQLAGSLDIAHLPTPLSARKSPPIFRKTAANSMSWFTESMRPSTGKYRPSGRMSLIWFPISVPGESFTCWPTLFSGSMNG